MQPDMMTVNSPGHASEQARAEHDADNRDGDRTRESGENRDGLERGAGDPVGPGDPVLDAMQHQVAVFARRAEQTRLGGIGQARNSMDRAAYLLLNRLEQVGPMGVKALASGMGIDSSTVTRQVAPLVEAGLVTRTTHPEDGRAVVLKLSSHGTARLGQVRSSRRELMALLTEEWSEEDRETFCRLLTRFNGAMHGIHPSTEPTEAPAS
jgi:DNA-binding MarR family transcriptional regulator